MPSTNPARRRLAALPVIAALLAAAPAAAATDDDAQVWMTAAASGQLSGNLAASFDLTGRFYNNGTHLSYVIGRGMLGWRFAPGVIAGLGYGRVESMPEGRPATHENQIFEHVAYPVAQFGHVKLSGRTRLEQRFFSNNPQTGWRLRQQLKLTVPLEGVKGLRAIVHSEAFFLLRQQGTTPAGLNQVRTFAGLGIPLGGKTALEAGYLNQTILPGSTRVNHVLALNLVTGF